MDLRSVIEENGFDETTSEEILKFFESLLHLHYGKEVEQLLIQPDPSKSYSISVEFAIIVECGVPIGTLLLDDPKRLLPLFNEALVNAQEKLKEYYTRQYKSTRSILLDRFIQKPAVTINRRQNQSNPSSQADSPINQKKQQKQQQQISVEPDQLIVKKKCTVRVNCLPTDFQDSHRPTLPRSNDYGAFVEFRGTVVRAVAPKVLEKSKEFYCVKCSYRFISHIDFEQQNNFPLPKKCPCPEKNCNNAFFKPSTTLGEHCDYQEIKIQEQLHHLDAGSIPRSLMVILQDDLVGCCQAGDDITVSGIVARKWSTIKHNDRPDLEMVLIANHIRIMNEQKYNEGVTEELRNEFEEYWLRYDNNPLEGRDKIVRRVCHGVYGMFVVKLALLLVVIGGVPVKDKVNGTNRRGECHMLLVGEPGTGKSQFLKFAAKIANRAVLTTGVGTTSAGLTAAAISTGGEMALEAGALVLADGGVCCIDEFNGISSSDSATIHEAMEQQTISIAKASIVTTLHTRTSIIAATNAKGKYNPDEDLTVNTNLGPALLSRFDIIMIITDIQSSDWDQYLSDFILNQAMNSKNGNQNIPKLDGDDALWTIETIQSYVYYVRTAFQPQFTNDARELITKYYNMQRRSTDRNEARVTTRLLESLIRLSQAHARLMFRNFVEVQDSIVAIYLIECCAESKCILNDLNPQKSVPPDDPDDNYRRLERAIRRGLGLQTNTSNSKQNQKRQKSSTKKATHTTNSNWATSRDEIDEEEEEEVGGNGQDEENLDHSEQYVSGSGEEGIGGGGDIEEDFVQPQDDIPRVEEYISNCQSRVQNDFHPQYNQTPPPPPPPTFNHPHSRPSPPTNSHTNNNQHHQQSISNDDGDIIMETPETNNFEKELDTFKRDAKEDDNWADDDEDENDDDDIQFSQSQAQSAPPPPSATTMKSLIPQFNPPPPQQPVQSNQQEDEEDLADLDWI